MKPQNLQDAIKASASKKKDKISTGGWKEPVVKKHKMSAEEYKQIKKPQAPMAVAGAPSYASGSSAGTEIIQQMQRERNELKKETSSLLSELKEQRREMKEYHQELKDNRSEMAQLRKDMAKMSQDMVGFKQGAKSTVSGSSPLSLADIPLPYTTDELCETQRKDKILREYLKSKTGLPYAGKHMTVEMIEESRLVYFKKKVYIPDRLRRKTVKYYCHAYPDTPKETIRENCIWPEMDQDMDNYLQRM